MIITRALLTKSGTSRLKIRPDDGFTLIELLVVLIILGLLAAIAGPRVIGYLGGARSDTASVQLESFRLALDLFRLDVGKYPTTEQGLHALIEAPNGAFGWSGPYLDGRQVPLDPWGNPYLYRVPGTDWLYDLFSLGADNRPGGSGEDADIGRVAR